MTAPTVMVAGGPGMWRRLRYTSGMSRAQVVRRMEALARDRGQGLPDADSLHRNLSRWESDRVVPSGFYHGLLCEVFDVPADVPPPGVEVEPLDVRTELAALRSQVGDLVALVRALTAGSVVA